ncbi:30S ribosomal protein S1 [Roseivirga sp. 4D4]|uniref:30S ribosomal protein S1 n=1 Tax=Roseivirga sp. 4D4 TaxID=1889784 RepID=UPI0008531C61|nr:30S ribosomal protein S1 [Roseivirga sp. 4D4]OEK01732.1 30S ribosomal protein S1 [Roseivirga sp. 4D4]
MSEEKKAPEAVEETVVAQETQEAPAVEEKVEATEVAEETPVVEEKPKAKKAPAKKAAKKEAEPAQEEFDWEAFETKGFGEGYSSKEREDLEALYGDTLNTIEEKKVIHGTVVSITPRDIVLNIGYKSDGLVSSSEFRDTPDLKIGDQIEVYIEEQENAQGQLVLSRRKAKIVRAWELIQDASENDKVIEGFVKRRTKGGLIVDVYGVESFLPGSQIDVKPIRDFDVFVGKKMEVKVVKINYTNDNVVVSHKVLIEKDLEKQKALILENLEKGQVLEGVIKNMTNFGVFIDLGGVDGLLHITDISWGRINDPAEVLNLDEKVNVVVLDFDDDKRRISLGMKQLTEHPWDQLDAAIEVGSKVKGSIVNVADYGAFLELNAGVEGLIHVSEMSWSQHLRNPQDFISVGDELEAVVLTLDRDERKMSLGIKQLTEDPWTKQDVLTKYGVGTNHTGIVRNLTNFGLFIELEEGIDGLVHVSDLSWTKKIKHPSEFVKVGDELEVQVLELDIDNKRLALGHKQLEENPWDTFETVFTPGSAHKTTVISKNDKGASLELPYGLEGIATNKNLKKEDGSNVEVGETLDFVVVEFSKDDKRIVMSHTYTHTAPEKPAAPVRKAKSGGSAKAKAKLKNNDAEVSTLGDLDALSALKAEMEDNTKKANEKKAADKKKADAKATKAKKEEAPKAEAPEADAAEEATEE